MTRREMAEKLRKEAKETRDQFVHRLTADVPVLETQIQNNQLLIMDALAMLLDGTGSSVSTW
jgi:hypothetical protein